ncbi:MAG TPA: hypothetical protein PKD53_17570, partial [Chloroflexaceae bacterium]|nr:hypothetical protein [Chloroflexaceae bacterium]
PRGGAGGAGGGLPAAPAPFRPRAGGGARGGGPPTPGRPPPADRRDWERTLEARIAQQESLAQALLDALGAAEEATLPGLRADLIAALSGPDKPPDIAGAELGERLLIDMANSGCQLTTRASQAIVTVQQLLWSLRAGRLKDPWPTLSLDAEQFDAEWAWLGSYATWRAAMLVFLYPENVLLPSLRPRQTPAFRRLVARVSAAGPVRPEEACDLANEYAAYFADVCNLSLKATCSADYVAPGGAARCSPAERESAPRKRSGLFLFAQSKLSGSVYLSTLDPGQQAAHAQSYWERVPGLEAFHSSDIIGAVSYEVSESESYIYLFLRVAEAAQGKLKYELAYLKYDLNKAVEPWDDEITRLEIKTRPTPAGVAQSVTASQLSPWAAVLCQNRSRHKPPLLSIQLDSASPKAIYCNTLDSAGKGLAHEYWLQWPALRSQVETTGGRWRFRDGKYYQLVGLCEHQVQRGGAAPLTGHILLFQQAFPSEGAWLAGFEPTVTNRIAAFCDVAAPKGYQDVTQEDPDAALYRQNFALETLGASDYSSKSHRFAGMRAGLPRGDVWAFVKEERSNAYEYVTLGFTMREPAAGAAPGAITDGRFYHALSAVPVNPSHLLGTVAVHGGTFGGAEIPIAVHRADAEGGARPRNGLFLVQCAQNPATGYVLGASISATRIAPHVLQDDPVAEGWARLTPLTDDQRGTRRAFTTLALWYSYGNDLLHYNQSASTVARDYVEEAYFALPLFIARTLARHQLFTHALDWFRNVYDHTAPQSGDRKIWRGLTQEEGYGHSYMREDQWLADPIDPHRIVRAHTRTKFVVLSIVQTLLAYADAEYSLDTAEAHARARSLYAQARELLDLPELGQGPDQCAQELGELVVHLRALPQIAPGDVARLAGRLNGAALGRLATTVRSILAADEGQATKAERVRALLHATGRDAADPWTLAQQLDRSYLADVKAQRVLLAGAGLALTDRAPSVAPGSGPPMTWLPSSFAFCVPPNPVVAALRFHAELNLYKLRTCRNIAGMERELDPYGAPTGATSGLPAIGAGGRLILPGATSIQPTQYRYATLVERARQLAGLAQQMEASMLAALEKGDAERYHLLKARQDARLTRAGVRLQDLRVQEAERGVALVELQRERASIQFEHFDGLIGAGLLGQEWWAAALLWTNVALQFSVGAIATGGAVAAGLVAGGVLGAKSGPGALVTALAGGGSAAALAMSLSQTAYSSITGGIATTSSALSLWAGFERRRQEWELQRSLAEQDGRIGDQQILLARDRVWITGQEREIARIQADHADDVTEFLSTKFTSAELYDWMSGVMEGVYRYFLRQATGVARLAEHQLAFERQELPPAFIQADYWDAPRDAAAAPDGDGGPDRRGLTGSARLLQDLYRLDQHAFETDRRKLQLTRTISLARLDPFAFQLLRERGVMVFATPMELFDRDFPGHYLRLIRRVRTSVIALVPPVEGLKATLATTGISRVVVGGDLFQTTVVNRGPESVALTSPQNATGLFELEAQGQGGMLLPFEGLGVDTTWELRIPAPANAFDFRTIADVLVTIEYTALDSPLYRRQVIERLDRRVSADRPFSFRHQFADAWYDLHNPDLTATPLEVAFTTRREDFPPNVEALTIEHVTLYVARGPGVSAEVAIRHLRFAPQGGEGEAGGPATTAGGAASTRQGNGGTWLAMVGKPPVGAWTLALEDTPEVRGLLKSGQVEDILLVITCGGQTAEWPA